jgi:D-galactarolactone cycloisomerase
MNRRNFMKSTACLSLATAVSSMSASPLPIDRSDIRITKIESYTIRPKRWKMIGKNSHKDRHGQLGRDLFLRIHTNAGIEGIGYARVEQQQAAQLIGQDPLSYMTPGEGIISPLDRGDAPLWDLAGKIYDVPTWKLFGGYGPEWLPVYDGSIYFADIMPEYVSQGIDRILYEVDYSLKMGHRAYKIKIGRGWKWMEKEAGLRRDIEVVKAIRKLVGPDVKLGVDANNGYDYATTIRFLEGIDDELYFTEEMFPETVEEDLALKAWLRKQGLKTLLADGESAKEESHFTPYINARAMDVLQGDMRRFGFTRLLRLSRMSASAGIYLAPHNWGSYMGGYMQAILGRGIPNLLMAELDPAQTDLFDVDDFELKEGKMRVPDIPGCGLVLKDRELAKLEADWVVE